MRPGYLKDATATPRGYVSPKGELLKAAKLTQAQIDEWNGTTTEVVPEPEIQNDVIADDEIVIIKVEEKDVVDSDQPKRGILSKIFGGEK